jgi:hypothetical protein
MRRVALAVVCLLALAPAAAAAEKPQLTKARATTIFIAYPKVAHWLKHYAPKTRTTEATYKNGAWTVKVWTDIDHVGEVATGKVDDGGRRVTEAWTGPQVAWKMARGYPGAFGGKEINSGRVWFSLCAVFLIGLLDFRRLLSWRNLDLLVLVSFTVSLWYFNDGRVFASMALAYPPLAYLLGRMVWSGWRGRSHTPRPRTATSRSRATARRAARPTPTARSETGSRRTAAASPRTLRGTRTVRPRTRPTCPATGSSAGAGSGTTYPRRTSPQSSRTSSACSASPS